MRARAEKGDTKAEYSLGYMYYHGKGVPQDYAEAVRWYRKAAEQGGPEGQRELASVYYYGKEYHRTMLRPRAGTAVPLTREMRWLRVIWDPCTTKERVCSRIIPRR